MREGTSIQRSMFYVQNLIVIARRSRGDLKRWDCHALRARNDPLRHPSFCFSLFTIHYRLSTAFMLFTIDYSLPLLELAFSEVHAALECGVALPDLFVGESFDPVDAEILYVEGGHHGPHDDCLLDRLR